MPSGGHAEKLCLSEESQPFPRCVAPWDDAVRNGSGGTLAMALTATIAEHAVGNRLQDVAGAFLGTRG